MEPHPHNCVYELIGPDCVDGVIVVSNLAGSAGAEAIRPLFDSYAGLPLCCLGLAVPGVPSVVIDNQVGMRGVIEHLIRDHGCKNLAYIGGMPRNPDAECRLAVYRETLARYGLPFDPLRVASGNFIRHIAEKVMLEILDRGAEIDGVVAANDGMALGAVTALHTRGLRVPHDLPVTGFDDLVMARLGNPPLTTVRQPMEAMASAAVQLLSDQLAGQSVPPITELPTQVVIRQSCGCNHRSAKLRPEAREPVQTLPGEYLSCHERRITAMLASTLGCELGPAGNHASELVTALSAELNGQAGAFLAAVERVLNQVQDDNESHQSFQLTITNLREEFRDFKTAELEDLWDETRTLAAITNTRSQTQQRCTMDGDYQRLVLAGEQIATAFDVKSLEGGLLSGLRCVGLDTAFIARYVDGAAGDLEPLLYLLDGQQQELMFSRLPARHLTPADYYSSPRRRTSLVLPLVFEGKRLGIGVFEYRAGIKGYQMFRDQISAVLRNASLHQEIVNQTLLHERSVQERLATAKRTQSLSVLAGGVAHDLNNALGPLVALPDIILQELGVTDPALMSTLTDVRADVESIKAASLRAAQTIKDLLTLGRQGRTSKEPLDLSQIVTGCLAGEPLHYLRDVELRVRVTLDLYPDPLMVQASESQLVRAITNLIRNAAEAIAGTGSVSIQTKPISLVESIAGYETVEPGEYAAVTVADTGMGIPAHELGRVFEPFFSKKRAGENSGTGLGLAIVHGVVKEHDGFLDVTSAVGRGTKFTLYLPRVRVGRRRAEVTCAAPRGRAKVLIVDDEPIQLRTARRVLTHLGYQVDGIQSGKQAHAIFVHAAAELRSAGIAAADWRSPYDLVVMDMILNEDQDGLRVFEQIQALVPDQRAVISSGHAPTERAELAIERGLPWLVKPYTSEALALAIRSALELHAASSVVRVASTIPPGSVRKTF